MNRKLGIWMDYFHAHLKEYGTDFLEDIDEDLSQQKVQPIQGESIIHNMEKNKQSSFYKYLGIIISEYKEILLFGPTEAKLELYKMLKADHQFQHIKIEIKNSGRLSDQQERSIILAHFR